MVNARHKEVLKGSTSKEAGPSASDADHGDSGYSFSSKGLNYRGFTLSSMKLRQVGKAIKNAMPYYISQTTDNFKELLQGETQINFASNFLRDRAKMWWDEKVCDKAEEVDKILEEFETLMQTNETVKELLKKFNELIPYCPGYHGNEKLKVREADLLRKKNKEGKETKRKLEFGDQDTKKPKHDHGRRGGGTQTKTPCKKCNKAHLGSGTVLFCDLYNNLRVFESDIKGSTASSSSSQNVAFVSENTSSTNEVSTAYCVPNSSGQNSKIKGTQDNKRRDAWNSRNKDGSRTGQKEDSKALVTIDGEGVDWTNHSEDEDYALMACNSSDSDTKREQLSDASIEIKAYSQGLKKVEAQLVAHQQGQLCAEPSELVSEPVVNESNVECQPKVWSDAPIIEEYESDSEHEYVFFIPTKQQETPSFANQQEFNHLLEDCDIHGKRDMARKADLNNGWNNVQRVNKKNQFVPSAVLTRTGLSTIELLDKGIVDSGCSRHMTGNKAYLAEFQDFNGGPVAFGGSKGYITGKGKIKWIGFKRFSPDENQVVHL
ncbi:hypothetical protein Tco_0154394 [Tanacetum coccineum]